MGGLTLQIRSRLRVRQDSPSTTATTSSRLEPGDIVSAIAEVSGEAVAGNALWYELDDHRYIWSGGAVAVPTDTAPPGTAGLPVATYPNGRIRVLDDAGIKRVFGTFTFEETKPRGAISISQSWIDQNITTIDVPALANIRHRRLEVHRLSAQPFERAFAAILAAGMDDRILSCAGTFVPRHKTWDPQRGLSSHSWGIAIDLNAQWNGYGTTPPAVGAIGSVRELIPYFAAHGFGWGGDFSGSPDGMHFELALQHF